MAAAGPAGRIAEAEPRLVDYRARPLSAADLAMLRRIDELPLDYPGGW
jgi:hypothetical protein